MIFLSGQIFQSHNYEKFLEQKTLTQKKKISIRLLKQKFTLLRPSNSKKKNLLLVHFSPLHIKLRGQTSMDYMYVTSNCQHAID